jgi:hypothetical protein
MSETTKKLLKISSCRKQHASLEVLTEVLLKIEVFWYVEPCRLVKGESTEDSFTLTIRAVQFIDTLISVSLSAQPDIQKDLKLRVYVT